MIFSLYGDYTVHTDFGGCEVTWDVQDAYSKTLFCVGDDSANNCDAVNDEAISIGTDNTQTSAGYA